MRPERVAQAGLRRRGRSAELIMMRALLPFLFGLLAFLTIDAGADELPWKTSVPEALAQAKSEHKFVLLYFHGSDWCPPCIEMQHQVLQSPAFAAFARRSLVLVDVDFPEKSPQAAELKSANLALKTKFNVGDNFPTIALLDDSGQTLLQEAGYSGGDPDEVIPRLQRHVNPPEASAAKFKNVDVREFVTLAADKQNVILDVRTPKEFEAGHLIGAVNIDVNSPDFADRVGGLDKSKTYLVHCASGVRSVKACDKLSKLDFQKLYNLTGGYRAWVKAGQPVEGASGK